MERLLLTLAPYLLGFGGLVPCVFLFVSLKREMHKLRKLEAETRSRTRLGIEALEDRMRDLAAELQRSEEQAGHLVTPQPTVSGLNLTKRSQVLRMSRQGAQRDSIAAALGMPTQEVDLLLKVHQLAMNATIGAP